MRGITQNALTVDLEDWFQVAAFFPYIPRSDWENIELKSSRVEANTERLLGLLEERGTKATFFVLGWIAERHPALVKKLSSLGHEIACHGYSHRLVYEQTPEEFKAETHRAKAFLEDLLGKPVEGYRASTYSITAQSLWALDILLEEGFRYDSSIFPTRHPQYGVPGAKTTIHVLTAPCGAQIVEFPLSVRKVFKVPLPIAGGGYFRQFPYWYTRSGFRHLNEIGQPGIFYIHPWELDPEQPRVEGITAATRLRHYRNLDRCAQRFARLLKEFPFTTVQRVLLLEGMLAPVKELKRAA